MREHRHRRHVVELLLTIAVAAVPAAAFGQATLTVEQTAAFLREADIVRGRPIGSGITAPWRLTLSDGTVTHDAALNVANKQSNVERFVDGTFETNFVDSYRFNIAAYKLANLLEMQEAIPVTIERRWNGKIGALSWWVDDAMTEGDRLAQKLSPPNMLDWNRQIYRVRVFNNLVYDTDRNLGNMLIADWHCWMIDFTRAFRRWDKLPAQSDLQQISRGLLTSLRGLTQQAVADATKPYLNDSEISALLKRRERIVSHFDQLIVDRGEGAVVH